MHLKNYYFSHKVQYKLAGASLLNFQRGAGRRQRRVIPSREIFSITIRADGCVSPLGFLHLAYTLPRLALFFCHCLSLRALPLSLCALCHSSLSFLSFFLYFRCLSSLADSGNFFSFRGASSCLAPSAPFWQTVVVARPLSSLGFALGLPRVALRHYKCLNSRPGLKAPPARGHLLAMARNAQLISACAAPPSNCI